MKYSFLLIIILSLLVSCHRNKEVDSVLAKAEQLIESNPDSVVKLMENIKVEDSFTKSTQARYALLLSAARYKSDIYQNDSLISIAVKYYNKYGTHHDRLQAYYYIGGILRDMEEELKAQDYLIQALKVGDGLNDHNLLGRVNNNLGSMYLFQDAYEIGLPYLKEAVKEFEISGNIKGRSSALRNLGRAYSAIYEKPDSAILYYEKALEISDYKNSNNINTEIAYLYVEDKEYDKAYKYITEALLCMEKTGTVNYSTYLVYGNYFLGKGSLDSARIYLNKSLNSNFISTKANSTFHLAQLEERAGNIENSQKRYKEYVKLSYQEDQELRLEKIAKADKFYNHQKTSKQLQDLEIQKINLINIFLYFSLAFVIIVATFYFFYKKKQRQMYLQKERFNLWKQQEDLYNKLRIKEKESHIQTLENEILHIRQEQVMTISEESLKNSDAYNKLVNHATNKITNSDWQVLIDQTDKAYDRFTAKLKQILPSISEIEIRLCCLVKLNFPPSDIASILNLSRSTISTNRKRLYEKMHGEKGSSSLFDDFIRSL